MTRSALGSLAHLLEVGTDLPEEEVLEVLDVSRSGEPKDTLLNAYQVLSMDSRWKGRIASDIFAGRHTINGEILADEDVSTLALWLAQVYRMHPSTARVHEVVGVIAREHPHHPVRDWLEGLEWDGVHRLDTWLIEWFGVADRPLHHVLARRFCIGAVARIYEPGCQLDTVLVLTGPQGAGKSTGLRALAGDWFDNTSIDIGSKDSYLQLQGVWIYEFGELEGFKGREMTAVKQFITQPRDRFRRPYGRIPVDLARQCAFVGTTNEDAFLVDATGSRRWWPVTVGEIDRVAIAEHRGQLWAEAALAYAAGEQWHLTKSESELLREAHRAYEVHDVWADAVADWVTGQMSRDFSMAEIFSGALLRPTDRIERRDQMRMGDVLRRMGWTRERPGAGDRSTRGSRWRRPG